MNILDIESFRSKYSDITLTTVPSIKANDSKEALPHQVAAGSNAAAATVAAAVAPTTQALRVEMTRVPMVSDSATAAGFNYGIGAMQRRIVKQQQRQRTTVEAAAYALEYKQVMAKLEYTKYMQAQLQLLSLSTAKGERNALSLESAVPAAAAALPMAVGVLDPAANIVDKYNDLLRIIGGMPVNLPPSIIGARAPKERLMRDIAHARLLVRECLLMMQCDNNQQ